MKTNDADPFDLPIGLARREPVDAHVQECAQVAGLSMGLAAGVVVFERKAIPGDESSTHPSGPAVTASAVHVAVYAGFRGLSERKYRRPKWNRHASHVPLHDAITDKATTQKRVG